MLKTGDWHIEPGNPETGTLPRVALIIEPVETITKPDGTTYDVYRAADLADRIGPRCVERYAIRREPEPEPEPVWPLEVGRRVRRKEDHRDRPDLGTIIELGRAARVLWDDDSGTHGLPINYSPGALIVVDES